MEVILLVFFIGLLPAAIASSKGRSFGAWWFYGSMLFIVALPHALMLKLDPETKRLRTLSDSNGALKPCPHCLSIIPAAATACSHCTRPV